MKDRQFTCHRRPPSLRTLMSIGGISLSVLLMLFLCGAYNGVAEGSMEFIYRNQADLWVLQGGATNILRCTSILPYARAADLESIGGVQSVSPLLLLLATVGTEERPATVYLAGYDPRSAKGGPPRLVEGRAIASSAEIVLDRAFAAKYRYQVADTVILRACTLTVVGLSEGTNAFVIQYAFVSLERAWLLAGYPGIVTALLVDLEASADPRAVESAISELMPNARTFQNDAFVRNNLAEMQAGFLPFVCTISILGAVVLTAILSLLLSLSITERRRDLAVMKALGSSRAFLCAIVIRQALILAGTGVLVAAVAYPALTEFLTLLAPEVAVRMSLIQMVQIAAAALLVGMASALLALSRLRRIYVMEAFQ